MYTDIKEIIDMSKDYIILVDANCDLPKEYLANHKIPVMPMGYSVNGVDYPGFPPSEQEAKDFYNELRQGADTKTVALAPDTVKTVFEEYLKQDLDVLYLAFSSGLSSTYNNARIAREELIESYPDKEIFVVDTLAASLGEGLIIHYAVEMKKQGKTISEVARFVEENRQKFCHYFTVDDLHFLHRGGRVSKATAIVGSVLGIKPVLHVNEEGKLIAIGKVRGRKQSLEALVNKMESKIGENKNDIVFISHGDCKEDADYVAELIKKKFGIKSFLINYIGTSIGSHSGPGTVALFFVGDNRTEISK